jgi:UDP-N-acetylglucosamine--N-acetylmuramyl-(pentapeptide) pyrophosphoryl-undecaprenol N-acetylglucosamine transferase
MQLNQKKSLKTGEAPVIVLTGGGSGGHITPLLSLARALKEKQLESSVVYIGHKGDKFDNMQQRFGDFDFVGFVNAGKFRRYNGESLLSQLLDFLAKVHPDVVFSKGGFVAVPVGIAAKIRGIPIVTHDSDTIPGLANKIIGRWAMVRATGMPAEFYNFPKGKTVYTGIPIDGRIKRVDHSLQAKYKKEIGINPGNQVLLIVGGSLGARDINDKVLKIAQELLSVNPRLHLVHITGMQNGEEINKQYKVLLEGKAGQVTVLRYTNDLYKYVGAADLIVSRAGATAVAEFAAAKKACILIPNPFLTGGHQVKNAESLQKVGAVEVVANEASVETLLGKIVKLLSSPTKRESLANKLGSTAKLEAADNLAEILLDTCKQK